MKSEFKLGYLLAMISTALLPVLSGCETVSGLKVNNFDIGKSLQAASNAKKAIVPLSEVEEIELGEGIASNLLGLAPLHSDREVQRYVNSVGRWISMHSERPDLPWTFAVLDSNEVNAFAAPGGYVVLTKGMLLKMSSEAELAGVLGHEIAHVLRKHHLNAMQKASVTAAFRDGLDIAITAKNGNPNVLKVLSVGTALYARGLDKEDEFESDRMGVVLAARAGYDPFGLPAVLHSLQKVSNDNEGMQLMFQTHPKLSDRLNQLDGIMGKDFDRYDNLPSVQGRFERLMARIKSQ
ncbi:M48 family metalloprotease [Undibacterium fentianense]|uniref:M48 family metalloprotease n=1 Tax=Undibacterium fentianense TaxID=2828728 RepID=A0A941E1G8_9BURK|nr:M48 family metalloprotease [Undibacterium fentianense]MBR7800630.1 M48 family metalloprotease [Undibacterium fentianense]